MSNDNKKEGVNKIGINWYPGHMAKTKRLIKENINLIDIVYEVIDSRVPYSSKIRDIDSIIGNKPVLLIFSKYDLCDKKETDKFIDYYKNKGYYVMTCDLSSNFNVKKIFEASNNILKDKLSSFQSKGVKKDIIRALVVGVPNAGKSTLINRIVGKNVAVTGNKPGVTKNLNWIRAYKNIELLDSPGILWPKIDQEKEAFNLASTTAIKEDILPKEDVCIYIIKFLYKYYREILLDKYGVRNIDDFYDVFETIAKKRGFMSRGGAIDDERVINCVINDIKSGKIKGVTFDRIEDYEF